MPDGCTVDNVLGKLAALFENSGVKMDPDTLDVVNTSGQSLYHTTTTKIGAELHDSSPSDPLEDKAPSNSLNVNNLKKIFIDQRHPSGVLGENFVQPVLQFSRDFHAANWQNLQKARAAYNRGIKQVLDSMDTSGLNTTQKGYFAEWSNYLKDGGDFYRAGDRTGLSASIKDFAFNSVKSSPHVLSGHFISSSIKLASMYPLETPGAILKAVKGGLFKEIPALADMGLYGVQQMEHEAKSPLMQQWNGLVHLIDNPVANIAYYAGEIKGGQEEGLRAAQKMAFKFRLNDAPRQSWTPAGRDQVRFLNWTINSARLYAGLWADVGQKQGMDRLAAIGSLTAFHALPFVIGGAAAAAQGKDFTLGGVSASIPAVGISAYGLADPEGAAAIEQNKTGMSEMLAIRELTDLSVATGAFSRAVFQQVPKNLKDAAEYGREGSVDKALLELTSAGLNLSKAVKLPGAAGLINDGMTQKAFDIIKDQYEGTATEDFGTAMMHLVLPFTK